MHLVEGTFRPDRHGDRRDVTEPEAPRGSVSPPGWLPKAARKVWDQLAPEMVRLNLLSSLDVPTFAALCVTYAELQWATKQRGRWTTGSTGQRVLHPANQYRLSLIVQLRGLAECFGGTPASRARVEELIPLVDPVPAGPRPTRDGRPITDRLGNPA